MSLGWLETTVMGLAVMCILFFQKALQAKDLNVLQGTSSDIGIIRLKSIFLFKNYVCSHLLCLLAFLGFMIKGEKISSVTV